MSTSLSVKLPFNIDGMMESSLGKYDSETDSIVTVDERSDPILHDTFPCFYRDDIVPHNCRGTDLPFPEKCAVTFDKPIRSLIDEEVSLGVAITTPIETMRFEVIFSDRDGQQRLRRALPRGDHRELGPAWPTRDGEHIILDGYDISMLFSKKMDTPFVTEDGLQFEMMLHVL